MDKEKQFYDFIVKKLFYEKFTNYHITFAHAYFILSFQYFLLIVINIITKLQLIAVPHKNMY